MKTIGLLARCVVALAALGGVLLSACTRDISSTSVAPGVEARGAERDPEKGAESARAPTGPGTNLLVVTLDTTRADRLGAYGRGAAQTPAFDALASRGVLFEQAFAQSPMTLPSHATLFTGLAPLEHGARVNGEHRLDERPTTLAGILSRRGYTTGAFVAAFVLDRKFGLSRGFETYDDDLAAALEQEVPQPLSLYRSGARVVDAALSWLEGAAAGERPFFAWVHLYDAHYPWRAHPELDGTPLAGQASYDAEIAYTDLQLARLVEFLERRVRSPTVVVVVADHGEGLGDHGEIEHGHMLYEEILHVPLLIASLGKSDVARRVQALVSTIDVFPTLLDLLGIEAPDQGIGRSLRVAIEGGTIPSLPSYAETDLSQTNFGWSSQRSLTTTDWKYIRTTRPELFDRPADPAELRNLASARSDRREELERQLSALERSMSPARSTGVTLDPDERQRLEALGYLTGDAGEADPGPAGEVPERPDIKTMMPVKHLAARLRWGKARGVLGPAEILSLSKELVEKSPGTLAFRRDFGWALLDAGRPADAVEQFEAAVEIDPGSAAAHYGRGEALHWLGSDPREAERAFREALRLDPAMAAAHVGLGNVLGGLERADLAAGHYAEALRLRPDYPEAHFNLARNLAARGRTDLAVEHLEVAVAERPNWAAAHFELANGLRETDRPGVAIEHYETAHRLAPSADALNNLGVALAAVGRSSDALARYEEALELAPDFHRPHVNLANLHVAAGRWPEAVAHYERAVELRPEAPAILRQFAWTLATCPRADQRDPARAVELAERARARNPHESPLLLDTLAAAYAAAGRFPEAVKTADLALGWARVRDDMLLAAEIEAHKELFESARPFVATTGGRAIAS